MIRFLTSTFIPPLFLGYFIKKAALYRAAFLYKIINNYYLITPVKLNGNVASFGRLTLLPSIQPPF